MKLSSIVLLIFTLLLGCMDQDPFGLSTRKIVAEYSLEKFEGGLYYIEGPGGTDTGGVLEGIVLEVGWNKKIILAKRKANCSCDPNGWMIIEIKEKKIIGPISEEEYQKIKKEQNIITYPPDEAWKKLGLF